ncbi:MAG: transglutaminase-like domain-containing protein [Bacteroidales bacterium]|nr:transglutaminase-like domain-containing protein [Bacteroidales bacterium]
MTDIREIEDLAVLFDDKDEVVSRCVDKRIIELGREVIPQLEELRRKSQDLDFKRLLSHRIFAYNAKFRILDLARLSSGKTALPFNLYEGSFLISSMLNPQIERSQFEDAFFQCAFEFRQEISSQRTAIENMGLFNHIFFHRLRFSICDQQITTEKNASIYETLRSRRGNPFTVAIIYMMMAEEAGLPLYPLCFQGGFIPAYVEKGRELFYANLFQNGEIFNESKLKDYMIEQGMSLDHARFLIRRNTVLLNIYLESLIYLYGNLEASRSLAIAQEALNALGGERFLETNDKQED